MKKLILPFVLFWAMSVFASDIPGVRVSVELVNGAKQSAQFLGIQNDTVSLGGSIQGKFTVVRIPASRFKSITDNQGNNLLNQAAPAQADSTVAETASADTATQAASTQVDSTQEASAQDSLQQPFVQTYSDPTFLDSIDGKHIYVALESRGSDSALAEQINQLSIKLIKEGGTPITYMPRSKFTSFIDAANIKDSLQAHGAASAYIGRITAARTADSLSVQMSHFVFSDSTAPKAGLTANMNLSAIHSLSDALGNDKMRLFIATLQGEPLARKANAIKNKSYIRVDTDPDGANIVVHGHNDICKSPCTFATIDTGKAVLYAYWNVNNQLWSARSAFMPIPADTTKISLRLKKVKPELRVNTIPEGADIYAGSGVITKSTAPIGRSPGHYPIFEPGLSTIQIRKAGFRDTVLTVFAAPTEITNVTVELTPIKDLQEQIAQEEWLRDRQKNFVGKTLMGTSIAPFLLGALFTYLAKTDYDDAEHIKNDLDRPAAGGSNYKEQVKKNKDLVKSGDRNMIIGGTLLGAGALLLGVGIVLTF